MKKYQHHSYESPSSHLQFVLSQDLRSQPKDDKDKMLSFNKSEGLSRIPYRMQTPSPMMRTPAILSFIEDKSNRFEPWHLHELCNNLNVNRQMENLISQAINFSNQEDEEQDEVSSGQKNVEEIRENKLGQENTFMNHHKFRKIQSVYAFYSGQKKSRPKNKGLRKLSQKSYQIVKRIGSTTYKQVALKLIQELSLEKQPLKDEKEQQNIKRRVYDALNVLIALGILRKEGRQIICNDKSSFPKKDQFKNLMLKKNKLESSLSQKEKIRQKKIEQYEQLKQKVEKYSSLIQRNKNKKYVHQIVFPLLGVSSEIQPETEQKKNLNIGGERVQIKGLKCFSLVKQEEMIRYLNI